MDKQIQQEALKLVQAMADQLGVAGKHVWATLVRQVAMEGIAWGVLSGVILVIALAFLALCGWVAFNSIKRNDGDGFNVCLIGGGVAAILTFISAGEVVTNCLKIANPEYYAIKTLTEMVKPAKAD